MTISMTISMDTVLGTLRVVAGVAIFFVWVVRYENIRKEFQEYGLPSWLRDFIGIIKISFVAIIQFPNDEYILLGSAGITILMLGAVVTHIRMKNSFSKYLPSIAMLSISLILFFNSLLK